MAAPRVKKPDADALSKGIALSLVFVMITNIVVYANFVVYRRALEYDKFNGALSLSNCTTDYDTMQTFCNDRGFNVSTACNEHSDRMAIVDKHYGAYALYMLLGPAFIVSLLVVMLHCVLFSGVNPSDIPTSIDTFGRGLPFIVALFSGLFLAISGVMSLDKSTPNFDLLNKWICEGNFCNLTPLPEVEKGFLLTSLSPPDIRILILAALPLAICTLSSLFAHCYFRGEMSALKEDPKKPLLDEESTNSVDKTPFYGATSHKLSEEELQAINLA